MLGEIVTILVKHRTAFVQGLLCTLQLSLYIWSIGLIVGVSLGAGAHSRRVLRWVVVSGAFFFTSVPTLVVLFWLHYPLQKMCAIVIDPFWTTAMTLSAVNVALVAQATMQALVTFPQQYLTAGIVCGMNPRDMLWKIQLPMLRRNLLPQFLGLQVTMLQLTLFGSLISVDELFRTAQRINALEYKPVEVYTALAVFFLLICLPLNLLTGRLRTATTRDTSER
jgi:His/Glu/Gln/Arg/opine family amino acid ABC transporter permease subunit